jgi:methyl-accepting chemotaxis protein
VQEINRSGSQIMEAINQIREGARSQASATEESVSALTQIQKGLEIAQERGTKSLDAVREIQDSLTTNKKLVDSLINGIGNSMSSTQDSIKRVTDLELLSRRIDKIVDAIATVSIQTNMLAVNGSIEAARAGEFGKGFVVVATDIRNLAHDSAENADRIKDLVKAVQDQIGVVGKDLAEIVVSAQAEVEKSKLSTSNLQIIETDVSEIEKGAAEILAVSDEIAAAINQVKTGVDQISAAAQEAEKAASEAATAATQQSQGAEELASAIEEIASLADELQSA